MTFNETINTGTTPGDGQGAGLRTNMRKLIENDNYLKQEIENFNTIDYTITESNGVTILSPKDAHKSFSTTNNIGAIKIVLPQFWSQTMMKLFIEIYNFSTGKPFTLIISAYNTNNWGVQSVQIIGSDITVNYPIRFGHNGTNACIYIGELNTSWSYLTVSVTKGVFSFLNNSPDKWIQGWGVSLESTAFENVTKTITNNLPVAQ